MQFMMTNIYIHCQQIGTIVMIMIHICIVSLSVIYISWYKYRNVEEIDFFYLDWIIDIFYYIVFTK